MTGDEGAVSILTSLHTRRTPPGSFSRATATRERGRLRRTRPVWAAALTALVLQLLWARYLAGVGGDLAAQWAWADFSARHPDSAYDLAWYGGIHPASYSVVAPWLMAVLGVRAVAVAAGTGGAALLGLLVVRARLHRPLPVALWGAFALTCNLAAGRVTFALGLAFGLAAVVPALAPPAAAAPRGAPVGAARAATAPTSGPAGAGTAAVGTSGVGASAVGASAVGASAVGASAAGASAVGASGMVPGRAIGWGRVAAVAGCALLATLSSPVAGLFVDVVAAALLLTRRPGAGWALGLPPLLAVGGTTLLFPYQGVDPITMPTMLVSAGCAALVGVLSPVHWRTVRAGALVYGAGAVLTWLVSTPIGSNVQRLALLFGSVVLLAVLCARPFPGFHRRSTALLGAFAAAAYWLVAADIVGIPAPSPPRLAVPLLAELRQLDAGAGRVEAVPMLNHWESWGLVPAVELARGWNRQLDVQRNPLFYGGELTSTAYHDWLRRWAVGYVAVPAAPLDSAATAEAAVIRTGPSWLHEVWHDPDWTLYRVADAVPLAAAPATVQRADDSQVVIGVPVAGRVPVRIAWSPWLSAHGPAGACLTRDGDWTVLHAPAPGTYRIDARYSWSPGTPC
ncbi:MFS transporter [Streptacidiphilus sp. EB129]|uniref:MFS transporter n=1 Tax=Streptacidiphilus sp. EB129 TaxID=3156262 RepID=UPI0035122C67